MIAVSIALGLVGAVLLLPTLSDLLSVCRLVTRRSSRIAAGAADVPRFLLLVPAHNEELLLPACLRSLQQLRYPQQRTDIVVVADNCTDRTADIARAAGVSCLVRTAPEDAGKPRAVGWALSRLSVAEYDAIVIVDADTEVDPDFAACAAAAAPIADKVLQPYNGVSNETENALTRMAAVLSAANHGLAYVLKTRAGVNVPLSVGMCIGSHVLSRVGWTVTALSEDWELYAILTARGVRIEAVPDARIRAQEAATLSASSPQRRRWTAGKLNVLANHAWPIVRSRQAGFAQKLDALAELSAPGPVVHLGLVALATAAAILLHPPVASGLVAMLLASLVRPAAYTVAALVRDPEPGSAIRAFAFLPFYALWRIGTAVTALGFLRDAAWVRTARAIRPERLRP
jgi:cellulose synthase/poly-beta-1,6-N-acetylglucosamine synthase-like glycosyltransferase